MTICSSVCKILALIFAADEEKAKLQKLMWPDPENHIPSVDVIAKPATQIANLAGITVPDDCGFLIVEENGTGARLPLFRRKTVTGACAL